MQLLSKHFSFRAQLISLSQLGKHIVSLHVLPIAQSLFVEHDTGTKKGKYFIKFMIVE